MDVKLLNEEQRNRKCYSANMVVVMDSLLKSSIANDSDF